MQVRPLLRHILGDEALTRGLGDPEARGLVEWLVAQAERLAEEVASEPTVWNEVRRRARGIGRFVTLWCHAAEVTSKFLLGITDIGYSYRVTPAAGSVELTWPFFHAPT